MTKLRRTYASSSYLETLVCNLDKNGLDMDPCHVGQTDKLECHSNYDNNICLCLKESITL